MIRNLLILLLLCPAFIAQAQIPNNSFENWTQIFTYENPNGWQTPNSLIAVSGSNKFTVKKAQDASDGTYAALLHTQFILIANEEVPGVMTTGTIGFDATTGAVSVSGGLPFTARPEKLTFDYKYFPAMTDSALVMAAFTRYDQGTRDTIGFALFTEVDSVKNYDSAELAINYLDPATPDTLLILFSSSSGTAASADGTRLWIDNLEVVYFTGERVPLSQALGLDMYPNPADFKLFITNPFDNQRMVRIFNLQGQEVAQQSLVPGQQTMQVDQLEAGVYLFDIETKGGEEPVTGRLVVK